MLNTVNGVPVIGVQRVPWKPDDDNDVIVRCESRGLVLFEGGGKSDAVVVEGRAIIWERTGERMRAFAVEPPRTLVHELHDVAEHIRRVALRSDLASARNVVALLLHVSGVINAQAGQLR